MSKFVYTDSSRKVRFASPYTKILQEESAIQQVHMWKKEGLRVVMADAVVDIPHYRHADYFLACANLGDKFLIRVDADELVATWKDPRGPIVQWEARAKHVAHYPYIDLVTIKCRQGLEFLKQYEPDVFVKSVTSGPIMLEQIEQLKAHKEAYPLEVVVMDQFAQIIDPTRSYEEVLAYEWDKYGEDKLSGTTIKQEIIKRALEGHNIET